MSTDLYKIIIHVVMYCSHHHQHLTTTVFEGMRETMDVGAFLSRKCADLGWKILWETMEVSLEKFNTVAVQMHSSLRMRAD